MDAILSNYPKILIKRFEAMGDILMSTPIIRKLYNDRSGKCLIDYQLYDTHQQILKYNPYIRNILGINDQLTDVYNMSINLDLVYEKKPKIHVIDAFAELVFGHSNIDKSLDLFTNELNRQQADKVKKSINNDYIVFHARNYPGASRNISLLFWQDLVKTVLMETNVSIAFIGQGNDAYFFRDEPRTIDLRNQFDILTTKEIISSAKIFVGSDTGTLHVAATTNTDIVGLFTSVRAEYRQPFRSKGRFIPVAANIPCYGCQENFTPPVVQINCMRNDYECQNRFSVQDVLWNIKNLLTS